MRFLPSLLAFMGVHLLAVASPGPAFVATVQLSVQHSLRTGLLHALGLGVAATIWAIAALVGLQALMDRIIWLYRALQVVGGLYLLYIGVRSWIHAKDPAPETVGPTAALTGPQAFRKGLALNISNPKVMVFFASIFAAVLDPAWPAWVRLAVPAIILVDETLWYAMLTLVLSTPRPQSTYRRAKRWIDRGAGCFLFLFGGKLLWSGVK